MGRRGDRSGGMRCYLVVRVRPMAGFPGAGQCRWLRSSLRLSRRGLGAWGGSASGKGGQTGSITGTRAPAGHRRR